MVLLDGHHRRRLVKILRAEDSVNWESEPLRMRYAFHVDGESISLAQAIRLSNIAYISTAFVRREATLTQTIQSFLSYAAAFEEDCGVRFGDLRNWTVWKT